MGKTERRVAVVGMGVSSPLGNNIDEMMRALTAGESGIIAVSEWEDIRGLRTKVAGICDLEGQENTIERKSRRSMGRVALLSSLAARKAVESSGLSREEIASPLCGVSFGSTSGGSADLEVYARRILANHSLEGILASHYLKCMSHTCAANLAVLFKCMGPLIASCTACTSGSQGVGFGYDAIRLGRAQMMITGGAEEAHFMNAAIFDLMMATSTKHNDSPWETPRPFDADRDGLVVSEGAGCLVLEEWDRAVKRGAPIVAELVGYATNGNGTHLTNSDADGIRRCMEAALADAGLAPERIDYINAHATATEVGDRAEAQATFQVFGGQTPVSSLKGHLGHTLGASGALESVATIEMLNRGLLVATRNLERPDPELPPLDYVRGGNRRGDYQYMINNNFAFGGVNTSLIFRKV